MPNITGNEVCRRENSGGAACIGFWIGAFFTGCAAIAIIAMTSGFGAIPLAIGGGATVAGGGFWSLVAWGVKKRRG